MSWSTAPAVATPRMMARTLGTFYAAAGIAGLLAVLGPDPVRDGRGIMVGLSVSGLVCAAASLRWGGRWPRWVFHLPVLSAIGLVGVGVLVSPNAATAVTAASLMAFAAIDACFFFSLPIAWVHMLLGLGTVTAALLSRGDSPASITLALDAVIVAIGLVTRGLVIKASSASSDPLTGLSNRRGFDDSLNELTTAATRSGEPLSAALLDLDHFKQVNDADGHEEGDRVLCRVAETWVAELPPSAVLARIGGDEFALLLPGFRGAETLQLVRRISALHPGTGLSIGIAELGRGQHAADLVRRADRALYAAKEAGRGRAELDGGASSELAGDLAAALTAAAVQVHYQPIVALSDGRIVGVEALARWNHPERGPISPVEFVPVAEQYGLAPALGAHVLATACAELAGVRTPSGEHVTVGVNVSGKELVVPGYLGRLRDVLAATGFPAEHLVLEVTESLFESESPVALATLHALHEAGITVSIDDFGTGYSSLARLDTLPAGVLKLDHSFIADVVRSPRRAHVLRSLAAMCAGLGLDVVAEGVETEEQAAAVRVLGCTFAQGWLYGRPVPLAELVDAFLGSDAAA